MSSFIGFVPEKQDVPRAPRSMDPAESIEHDRSGIIVEHVKEHASTNSLAEYLPRPGQAIFPNSGIDSENRRHRSDSFASLESDEDNLSKALHAERTAEAAIVAAAMEKLNGENALTFILVNSPSHD